MAVRNLSGLKAAVSSSESLQDVLVKKAKIDMQFIINCILEKRSDIKDAIDTYNYCINNNLKGIMYDFERNSEIYFSENGVCMTKRIGSTCYSDLMHIYCDGNNLYIKIGQFELANIANMVDDIYFYKSDYDELNGGYPVAPIWITRSQLSGGGRYTKIRSTDWYINHLNTYLKGLTLFLSKFFAKIDAM